MRLQGAGLPKLSYAPLRRFRQDRPRFPLPRAGQREQHSKSDAISPSQFLAEFCALRFEHPFNPFADRCAVHDRTRAPQARAKILLALLVAAERRGTRSLWLGRERILAVGRDAEHVAARVAPGVERVALRHPSFGGEAQFRAQVAALRCAPAQGREAPQFRPI